MPPKKKVAKKVEPKASAVSLPKGEKPTEAEAPKISLSFDEKNISSDKDSKELIKQLQLLHKELKENKPRNFDTKSLDSVSKTLVMKHLLSSKELKVKLHTAVCLVDVFRFYAPQDPFSEPTKEKIFSLLLEMIKLVSTTDKGRLELVNYILASLNKVKSIILVAELKNTDLATEYFHTLFKLASNEKNRSHVTHFANMLTAILDNLNSISYDMLSELISQFSSTSEHKPPSYTLAKDICKLSADTLQTPLSQYFADSIANASKVSDEGGLDIKALNEVHKSIEAIYTASPKVLGGLIQHIESELEDERHELRILATRTLGSLLASDPSLSNKHTSLWGNWTNKANDIKSLVRIAWVETCLKFYVNSSLLCPSLNNILVERVTDIDDKVRQSTLKMVSQLDISCIKQSVSTNFLKKISLRARDVKPNVRSEAILCLGKMYHAVHQELLEFNKDSSEKFGWIPSILLEAIYTSDKPLMYSVEACFKEYILPINMNSQKMMERLLVLVSELGEKSFNALKIFFILPQSTIKHFLLFLKRSNMLNDKTPTEKSKTEINSELSMFAKEITKDLPDSVELANTLVKYAHFATEAANEKIHQFLKASLNSEYKLDLKNEALKLVELIDPSYKTAIATIFDKVVPSYMNSSMIPHLLQRVKEFRAASQSESTLTQAEIKLGEAAIHLFKILNEHCPYIYRQNLQEIKELILKDSQKRLDGLATLVNYRNSDSLKDCMDEELMKLLTSLVIRGSVMEAKYSAQIIGSLKNRTNTVTELLRQFPYGLKLDNPFLASHLKAFGQFQMTHLSLTKKYNRGVVDFIMFTLLQFKTKEKTDLSDPLGELPPMLQAKLSGVSVLVNRLISEFTVDNRELLEMVFQLLMSLTTNGQLGDENSSSELYLARMRLKGATSFLKLARVPQLAKYFTHTHFSALAFVTQDAEFFVREGFCNKLMKYLLAVDPVDIFVQRVKTFIKSSLSRDKIGEKSARLVTNTIVRLIHLLAHDPDFSPGVDYLKLAQRYILFYLDTLATADNISDMFSIVGRIKAVEDAVSPPKTERLYILSELAHYIINKKKDAHQWYITPYAGKLSLPSDIFKHIATSGDQPAEPLRKTYLPEEFLEENAKLLSPTAFKEKIQRSSMHIPKSPRSVPSTPAHHERSDDKRTPAHKKSRSNPSTPKPQPTTKRPPLLSATSPHYKSKKSKK